MCMRRPQQWRVVTSAALGMVGWLLVCPVRAQEGDTEKSTMPGTTETAGESRWFIRAGAVGALYDSSASFAIGGQDIPGATAHARDNITAIFDVGYDVTKQFAVMMMAGVPPRTAVDGRGTVGSLGNLGAVRFAPVFLTGIYRLPWEWSDFRPYVGAGFAHAFILKDYDGAVTQLKVDGNSGFVLQTGIEYRLNESFGFFLDYKRLWLRLDADGLLGNVPVTASITLDSNLVSAGVRYQF
jgi:outer membrane protein